MSNTVNYTDAPADIELALEDAVVVNGLFHPLPSLPAKRKRKDHDSGRQAQPGAFRNTPINTMPRELQGLTLNREKVVHF